METVESIPGLWPGVVESYDGDARTCRVSVPGITDGSATLLEAVFNNPLGDRGDDDDAKSHTEIHIKAKDPVWLMFECGDPRFPIIMGFRTKRAGNPTNWRRWRHANIELTADNKLIINASDVEWNVTGNVTEKIGGALKTTAGTSTLDAASHDVTAQTSITGNTSITGGLSTQGGASGSGVTMKGPVAIEGGAVTHNGTNIGDTHSHTEQGDGQDVSPPH